jgi:hypothetical protein
MPGWLTALGVLVVLVLAVVMIERLANRPRPDPPPDAGEPSGRGCFGELVELFQPSAVHLPEEKERQRLDIVQRPAEGAALGDDPDAGVVYLPGDAEGQGRREDPSRGGGSASSS